MKELREQRDRDFMSAVARERKNPRNVGRGMRAIVAAAAAGPAPMYYVTYNHVMKELPGRNSMDVPVKDNTATARMWRELQRRVGQRMERYRDKKGEAVAMVLAEGGASSFFLSPSTAWVLYHKIKQRRSESVA